MSKNESKITEKPRTDPGEGIRSLRASYAFRAINFELYAKPNVVIMGIGVVSIISVFGYIGYMRAKYEGLGYYSAVKEDGSEVFEKKKSRWDR